MMSRAEYAAYAWLSVVLFLSLLVGTFLGGLK